MKKHLLYTLFILASCSGESGSVKQEMESLLSHPIEICQDAMITVRGRDSLVQDYFASDFKMVVYTDSMGCSSCALQSLYRWEDLIEYAEQFDGALKYYFIFNPPKSENIRMALRTSMLDYPMLLDSLGEFERLNPHLPRNKAMHTFLLDEDNNVVLVGNPLNNPEIEKMFKTIVEERLNNQ